MAKRRAPKESKKAELAEPSPSIEQAINHHQAGRFAEAETLYHRILDNEPRHFESLHYLGVLASQQGDHKRAIRQIDAALKVRPDVPEALNNRGVALTKLNCLEEALQSFDKAMELKPNYFDALLNRANALVALKRCDEALINFDTILAAVPDHDEALYCRGNALLQQKRWSEAVSCYDKAITLKPDYAEAFNHRGIALMGLKRFEDALSTFDRAVAINPRLAEAFSNRGIALKERGRFDEALASYERAIALKPDFVDAINNRGIALMKLKRIDEALASYDRAIELNPDHADTHMSRGICRLLAGHYREGWADYEWRWRTEDFQGKRPNIGAPLWAGEDIRGKRLAVYSEQGLGDTIQFARYLPLLAQRDVDVSLFAPSRLHRLLEPMLTGVTIVSPETVGKNFDFQCPLMSLPRWLGTELTSIPNGVPYLRAEDELAAWWRTRIGDTGFKIGIVWQGSPKSKTEQGRSIPLTEFLPLARLPGVRLISLQKQYGLDQLAQLPADARVESLGDIDSGPDAFIDTAAV